ncbi:hypothetical protein DQK91_02555 [Oceanidesulfovibrio marinus]|uniref:Uncharacterized protein n=2 Tax=Oceanidesulfovibrio marinus TaxID=370038 RepID=A0A6P1ZLJ4_9BACT|nr:hypothetical protein DQK91_02555 [Oceanidesulfovibrio marinus]
MGVAVLRLHAPAYRIDAEQYGMSTLQHLLKKAEALGREALKAKDAIADFCAGPHTIGIGNRELSRLDSRIASVMTDKGVEDLRVRLKDSLIHVTGRFPARGGGAFDVDLVPDGVVWTDDEHVLLFRIARQDVTMDGKVMNALQMAVTRTFNTLFGESFLNEKLGVVDRDGRVRVELDGEDSRLDAIMDSMEIHALECAGERLRITFTPRLKNALAHAKTVVSWWLKREKQDQGDGQKAG